MMRWGRRSCAAGIALCLVLWVSSLATGGSFVWLGPHYVGWSEGRLDYAFDRFVLPPPAFDWGFGWPSVDPWAPFFQLRIPFWLLICALAALWYVVLRERPQPAHLCVCGYDLTGNESGNCPECGQEVPT